MKLAVLTSGGDSAGMNAVVRAVVKAGILKCASSWREFVLAANTVTEAVKHGLFERDTKALYAETQKLIMLRTLFLF